MTRNQSHHRFMIHLARRIKAADMPFGKLPTGLKLAMLREEVGPLFSIEMTYKPPTTRKKVRAAA